MVGPSAKRVAVDFLRDVFQVGLSKCYQLIGLSRSSMYYQSRKDDSTIIEKLKELASKYPNRGFDNYFARIRREGHKWSRGRVLRVYRALGLVKRPKKRRRLPEELRQPLEKAMKINHTWSLDFMSDSLTDGRTIRILNVMDDYNREALLCEGSISFPAQRVVRCLQQIVETNGCPQRIRTDNGPEFLSKCYKDWCAENGIQRIYSPPGKPMENGYIERFNRTFREDVLDAYLFQNLNQLNNLASCWQHDYNSTHPHTALKGKSPEEFFQRPPQPLTLRSKAEADSVF